MVIDIIFLVILAVAAFKGFSRGLIMAVFSLASLFVGLAAALKLSSVVAAYLRRSDALPSQWWPVIAFILVFIGAMLVVRAIGKLLEKTVENVMLGPVNRIGGFLVFALLYLLMFSVVLFYLTQMNVLGEPLKTASVTYRYIAPWGPTAISWLGTIFPFFSSVFTELQAFFEKTGQRIPL